MSHCSQGEFLNKTGLSVAAELELDNRELDLGVSVSEVALCLHYRS